VTTKKEKATTTNEKTEGDTASKTKGGTTGSGDTQAAYDKAKSEYDSIYAQYSAASKELASLT